MPRSQRLFKKRKAIKRSEQANQETEENPTLDHIQGEPQIPLSTPDISSPSSSRSSSISSASSRKLGDFESEYDKLESSSKYDIVDILALSKVIGKVASCAKFNGTISLSVKSRNGLASKIVVQCSQCDLSDVYNNSSKIVLDEQKTKIDDLNLRTVYAFRSIGKGFSGAQLFCGIMNLPPPITRFPAYKKFLLDKVKKVCQDTMTDAIEEAVNVNGGSRDLPAAFDGTWQKRGHVSLNGIVTATSVDTGKAIDVSILSKFCHCPERLTNTHDTSCSANYLGVSGGMEVKGVIDIFQRSQELYNVRYTHYLGDGDSRGYKAVVEKKIYGEDCQVDKLECLGHVQKRMGSRLRNLKTKFKNSKAKLADGRSLSGRGQLTDKAILKIQNYYGEAIRKNTNSLEDMKSAIWAEYFHIASTNANPCHYLCPPGENSWCKYRKSEEMKTAYDHKKHFHLDPLIMAEIKPIFRDLANPELLKKCLHGGTQNSNESLNNIIWTRIPKNNFVQLPTLSVGVYDALASFNSGNIIKCIVLQQFGIDPGYFCVESLKKLDQARVKESERQMKLIQEKARQKRSLARRKLEDKFEESEVICDPSYSAGHH